MNTTSLPFGVKRKSSEGGAADRTSRFDDELQKSERLMGFITELASSGGLDSRHTKFIRWCKTVIGYVILGLWIIDLIRQIVDERH